MNKNCFEKHSVCTLAQRFRGLVCRNTIQAMLDDGRLKPEMGPTARDATYLFRREFLDRLTLELEKAQQERARRQVGNEAGARIIREAARREALETLK